LINFGSNWQDRVNIAWMALAPAATSGGGWLVVIVASFASLDPSVFVDPTFSGAGECAILGSVMAACRQLLSPLPDDADRLRWRRLLGHRKAPRV
jgi:hypothetical protein